MTGLKDKEIKGMTVGNLMTLIAVIATAIITWFSMGSKITSAQRDISDIQKQSTWIINSMSDIRKDNKAYKEKEDARWQQMMNIAQLNKIEIEKIKTKLGIK